MSYVVAMSYAYSFIVQHLMFIDCKYKQLSVNIKEKGKELTKKAPHAESPKCNKQVLLQTFITVICQLSNVTALLPFG